MIRLTAFTSRGRNFASSYDAGAEDGMPWPTPRNLKDPPPMDEQPRTLQDVRGNLIPRPAYEGWKPEGYPSRTLWDVASNIIGALALITFALRLRGAF